MPKSETVLIKNNNDWSMLFAFGGKIYVIKAPASLSTIELKAISKEIEKFLEKKTNGLLSQRDLEKQSADNFLIK
jgi:hypothetical protein